MCQLICSLKNATYLKHLSLKHIKQFNTYMEILNYSLKNHPSLKKLELNENSLSDYRHFIGLLRENQTIEYIDVRNNYINADIAKQINEGLQDNMSV